MKSYVVTWAIDIDAESPREAAEKALLIQRDAGSIATVFDVVEYEGDGEWRTVDLSEPEPILHNCGKAGYTIEMQAGETCDECHLVVES